MKIKILANLYRLAGISTFAIAAAATFRGRNANW